MQPMWNAFNISIIVILQPVAKKRFSGFTKIQDINKDIRPLNSVNTTKPRQVLFFPNHLSEMGIAKLAK